MIAKVDSSKIDLTAAKAFIADLFVEPTPKTLIEVVNEYKEDIKKAAPKTVKCFHDYVHPSTHAEKVLAMVCNVLEINIDSVKTNKKETDLVEARFIYCFIVMKLSSVQVSLKQAAENIFAFMLFEIRFSARRCKYT